MTEVFITIAIILAIEIGAHHYFKKEEDEQRNFRK